MKSKDIIDKIFIREKSSDQTVRGNAVFEMSNYGPETTGLPYTIWVSTKPHNHNTMRIKIEDKGYSATVLFNQSGEILRLRSKTPKHFTNNLIAPLRQYIRKNLDIITQAWKDQNKTTDARVFANKQRKV